ncbi:MAG: phthalyl amidase [Acidimicrobiia bacterium]|nr:phthalyl amidase [Acidimicrobiia bacterium]MDH5503711.1 phthalyl amidase [Acidimicrobiia bacterium]
MRKSLILMLSIAMVALTVPAAAAPGNGNGPAPKYFVDESALPFDAFPGATAMWGVHNGAGYRIEVPGNWNGDLVMWAHGYRGTGPELTVDNHPLRPLLIALGYAWASSSYSRNDYDVATGVQDTHALAKRFNGLVGNPDKVYLTGVSMGGHITAVSIEQYPTAYDAALPACGVLGDFELFDYFLDFNVAAQQLGAGSSAFPVDPLEYIGLTVPGIKANLEAVPGSWPFVLNAKGENLKSLTELRSGGERPNFDEAWSFWNSIPSDAGPGNFLFGLGTSNGSIARSPGNTVDNADVVYQFDTDPTLTTEEQAFNAGVVRVTQDPQGRSPNGLAQVPPISGKISIPVLTMHNLGDLFVPVHNEIVYAERVAAQGNGDLLVQRAIRGVLHCDFTAAEFSAAFLDLVAWVELGIKPAGDDWLDPLAVADPDFGCAHTNGSHVLGTPCP